MNTYPRCLVAYTFEFIADAPHKDIHSFIGTFTHVDEETGIEQREPLSVENTLWTNTVLASGSAIGFVIYTGKDTRAVMNTNHPKTKVGLLDTEINRLAKVHTPRSRYRLALTQSYHL